MDKRTLGKRLDRMTSILVRILEGRCATCEKQLPMRARQAGHFIPRVVKKTRWSLLNVHTQCAHCNVELDGNIKKYRKYIAKRYGVGTLSALEFTYNAYKAGRLKEPTFDEMKGQYNDWLQAIRAIEREPGEFLPKEWKKID